MAILTGFAVAGVWALAGYLTWDDAMIGETRNARAELAKIGTLPFAAPVAADYRSHPDTVAK